MVLLHLLHNGHKSGKAGILEDFSEHGKTRVEASGNSVQRQGIIVTNKIIFVSYSTYLCKATVLDFKWTVLCTLTWSECGGDLFDPWWRSLLQLFFGVIIYGKVSLWLWKNLENSREFFSLTLWPPWFVIPLYIQFIIVHYADKLQILYIDNRNCLKFSVSYTFKVYFERRYVWWPQLVGTICGYSFEIRYVLSPQWLIQWLISGDSGCWIAII